MALLECDGWSHPAASSQREPDTKLHRPLLAGHDRQTGCSMTDPQGLHQNKTHDMSTSGWAFQGVSSRERWTLVVPGEFFDWGGFRQASCVCLFAFVSTVRRRFLVSSPCLRRRALEVPVPLLSRTVSYIEPIESISCALININTNKGQHTYIRIIGTHSVGSAYTYVPNSFQEVVVYLSYSSTYEAVYSTVRCRVAAAGNKFAVAVPGHIRLAPPPRGVTRSAQLVAIGVCCARHLC